MVVSHSACTLSFRRGWRHWLCLSGWVFSKRSDQNGVHGLWVRFLPLSKRGWHLGWNQYLLGRVAVRRGSRWAEAPRSDVNGRPTLLLKVGKLGNSSVCVGWVRSGVRQTLFPEVERLSLRAAALHRGAEVLYRRWLLPVFRDARNVPRRCSLA